MPTKAIILVGGPSTGTRFRPLSLNIPKPLFPLGGVPILTHHLNACKKIEGLTEILLLGFFPPKPFEDFIADNKANYPVPIRYLQEQQSLGTAGGLYKFRKEILEGDPKHLFVVHIDILCAFPLKEMLDFHKSHGKDVTILAKKINPNEAQNYGCLVEDKATHEIIHFAEKPETFVSDLGNCGVYVFSPHIFQLVENVAARLRSAEENVYNERPSILPNGDAIISLEKDVLIPLAGKHGMCLFETSDFFIQLKHAGLVTRFNEVLLQQYRKSSAELLAKPGDGKSAPLIVGDVFIHPSATVHPSAKLGPNVSIGPNVKIRAGVRIKNAIILDNTEVKESACVLNSVISSSCVIGKWSRIEGVPNYNVSDKTSGGITIFGHDVTAAAEIIVRNSIVLPHKSLTESCTNDILL
jgi:mannose-1-phosphate guanylyltransferase